MKKIKGFKCFNKDFTCQNYQFKVGKTYKHDGDISLCREGFHFCLELKDVFNYYGFDASNHVCEIEASGKIASEGDKSVCSQLTVGRELSWDEVLKRSNLGANNLGFDNAGSDNAGNRNAGYGNAGSDNAGNSNAGSDNAGSGNAGSDNAGYGNAGNSNAGNSNAGSDNAGYGNAGYGNAGSDNAGTRNAGSDNAGSDNAGSDNAGYRNAGSDNAGNSNAGSDNAGNSNAGNRNAGYGNAGSDNAGAFNSSQGRLRLFNKDTDVPWNDPRIQNAVIYSPDFQEYVYFSNMTDIEKTQFPYAKTTGGYYRQLDYKEGWLRFWGNASESVRQAFLDLPNFDAAVFEEITGIKV